MTDVRLLAVVHGQVQGVGFRVWVRAQARQGGLRVDAQNMPDGTVRVVAHGPRPACLLLLDELSGPNAPGQVEEVTVTWHEPGGR